MAVLFSSDSLSNENPLAACSPLLRPPAQRWPLDRSRAELRRLENAHSRHPQMPPSHRLVLTSGAYPACQNRGTRRLNSARRRAGSATPRSTPSPPSFSPIPTHVEVDDRLPHRPAAPLPTRLGTIPPLPRSSSPPLESLHRRPAVHTSAGCPHHHRPRPPCSSHPLRRNLVSSAPPPARELNGDGLHKEVHDARDREERQTLELLQHRRLIIQPQPMLTLAVPMAEKTRDWARGTLTPPKRRSAPPTSRLRPCPCPPSCSGSRGQCGRRCRK